MDFQMNIIKRSLCGFVYSLIVISSLCSCDPDCMYVYVIKNETSKDVFISLNNDCNDQIADRNRNKCIYYKTIYDNTEYSYAEFKECTVVLKPREEIRFMDCVSVCSCVKDIPDVESTPPWGEDGCILEITNGTIQLESQGWINRQNWKKFREKGRYVEYWLLLTDEEFGN